MATVPPPPPHDYAASRREALNFYWKKFWRKTETIAEQEKILEREMRTLEQAAKTKKVRNKIDSIS